MNSVKVLANGYSRMEDGFMRAKCTCTLVRGPGMTMVIDTMTGWDKDLLLGGNLSRSRPMNRLVDYQIKSCTTFPMGKPPYVR
jgi:hypothetical protein